MIHLDDDLLRRVEQRRRQPDGRREEHLAVGRDLGGLDDSEVDLAKEAEQQRLRDVRQVHVHELDRAAVDLGAQRGTRLVRRAPRDGLGLGEVVVQLAGGCAGDHADPERPASLMFLAGAGGKGTRHELGRSSGREAAESDGLAVG